MEELHESLLKLADQIPVHYGVDNAERAKVIADKFGEILKKVMEIDKMNYQYWPGELEDIKNELHSSIWDKWRKAEKFNHATKNLKSDIQELASRIKWAAESSEKASQAPDDNE